MTKHKKDASVTLHGWYRNTDSGTLVICYRRCTVVSFGAKQAALCDVDSSSNLLHRVYPHVYGNITAGHGVSAEVVERLVADEVARYDHLLAFISSNPNHFYSASSVAKFTAVRDALRAGAYRVADLAELRKEASL